MYERLPKSSSLLVQLINDFKKKKKEMLQHYAIIRSTLFLSPNLRRHETAVVASALSFVQGGHIISSVHVT